MKKREISKIQCPKCKKTPIRLDEVGTVSASYFIENNKISSHQLNPDCFTPLYVNAICKCEHTWRLKGISSMDGIIEFMDYDESTDNELNKRNN